MTVTNSSFERKQKIATAFLANNCDSADMVVFDFWFHGVPVRIRTACPIFWEHLCKSVPRSWQTNQCTEPALELYWYSSSPHINSPAEFESESDFNYHYRIINGKQAIFQRDLILIAVSENSWRVMTMPEVTDGFMNVFRLLLPRYLFFANRLALHSCTVLNAKGEANVFLGDSGFGKSTIAGLAGTRSVLGDDINILRFTDKAIFAQSAFLGGDSKYKQSYQREFKVKQFFWLQKAEKNRLVKQGKLRACTRLAQAAFTWQLPAYHAESANVLLEFLCRYRHLISLSNLYFKPDKQVWSLID